MTNSASAKLFPLLQLAIILLNGFFFVRISLMLFPMVILSLLLAMLYVAYYNREGIKMYGIRGSKQYKYQDFVFIRPYITGVNLYKVTFTDGTDYIIGARGKYLLTAYENETAMTMETEIRSYFENAK